MLAGANHGLRYLTAANDETFAPGNALTVDSDGNVVDSGEEPGGGGSGSALRIRDGLAIEYDPTPSSPNTEDDEFNSSSLDGKWTVVTNTASSVDIDTTWRSHIYVKFTGNQIYSLLQSFAPAGDFSLTARVRYAVVDNFQRILLSARDNDASDAVFLEWQANSGATRCGLSTTDAGVNTFNRSVLARASVDGACVHLQRVGTTWSVWFSFNGLSWWRVGTHTKTVTIADFVLEVGQAGATIPVQCGIDWIRRDWLTL